MPNSIFKILYEIKRSDYSERYNELVDPRIIFVTDLVSCSHKRYFRQIYPELTFTFEPAQVLGELVHKGLEEVLKEKGFLIEHPIEKPIEVSGSMFTVKGRIDALSADRSVVVEIKTARSSQGTPHDHHVEQLRFYMLMIGAKRGVLVYITPDRLLEYVFDEPYTEDVFLERASEVVNDMVHPRWQWECKYCPFSRLCEYRVEQSK